MTGNLNAEISDNEGDIFRVDGRWLFGGDFSLRRWSSLAGKYFPSFDWSLEERKQVLDCRSDTGGNVGVLTISRRTPTVTHLFARTIRFNAWLVPH